MRAIPYDSPLAEVWNAAVRSSRNGTFLFERGFMEYHSARFEDCSLLFYDSHEKVCGLLPAAIDRKSRTVTSHGGLTYGGLVLTGDTTLGQAREMLRAAATAYKKAGAEKMIYKPVPFIYHRYPSEEGLYWLFRAGAELTARAVASVIDLSDALPYSTLRKRKLKKAGKSGLAITDCKGTDGYDAFWNILEEVLAERHATSPVHTRDEIKLLAGRFPQHIRLYTVACKDEIIAGCLVFMTAGVMHVQYIAANAEGRASGALDFLFNRLRDECSREGIRYLDFGISTERNGTYLNEGLQFQKEGLGGRAVCYDAYTVELDKLLQL